MHSAASRYIPSPTRRPQTEITTSRVSPTYNSTNKSQYTTRSYARIPSQHARFQYIQPNYPPKERAHPPTPNRPRNS
ncbi:hypothetical protein C8Q77DRAFT_1148707 [Trametes polyzona]|nr:hypothetical protein C8Q77DRAFT_1148707 [Trametes polyzona]